MPQVHWAELADQGLRRCVPPDRFEAARKAIELKLLLSAATSLRRHSAFPDRRIYVFTQFAGVILRIVVEAGHDTTVWHVGIQPPATE